MRYLLVGIWLSVLAAAVWNDFRSYRSPNVPVIAMMLFGLGFHLAQEGPEGFLNALAGCLLPFFLLFLLYACAMIGAGDIKLLMAAGAAAGLAGSLFILITSLFAGAILSVFLMIRHRNFSCRLQVFFQYLNRMRIRSTAQDRTIEPYYQLKAPVAGETLHFTICIAFASCLYMGCFL